jgi:uncharacterized repeat protein (TIGR02543 family)
MGRQTAGRQMTDRHTADRQAAGRDRKGRRPAGRARRRRFLCALLAAALACPALPPAGVEEAYAATAENYWEDYQELGNTAGQNLSGNYKVTRNLTLTGSAATSSADAGNGLNITGTTVLYLAAGVTLTVTGGAGYDAGSGNNGSSTGYSSRANGGTGAKGGGAGIRLPSGQSLFLRGEGTLIVTGGTGGKAGSGGDGGNAGLINNGPNRGDGLFFGGGGGGGGAGGGGGGAGIGTPGGNGRNGGNGGASSANTLHLAETDTADIDGGNGQAGGAGNASGAVGALFQLDTVKVTANGGGSGTSGSGGTSGSNVYQRWTNLYTAAGGAGGGGGGKGGSGASVGSGGSGGGGGGGGGSGGTTHFLASSSQNPSNDSASANFPSAAGGNGGIGSSNGNNGSGTKQTAGNASIAGGSGGSGGSAGTPGAGGTVKVASSVTSAVSLTAGNANAAAKTNITAYTLTYHANGGQLGSVPATQRTYNSSDVNPLVQRLSKYSPSREGHAFLGWAASQNAQQPDSATPAPSGGQGAVYSKSGNQTLYAVYSPVVYTFALLPNAAEGVTDNGATYAYQRYGDAWYLDPSASQPIAQGSPASPPARTGYDFAGYYLPAGADTANDGVTVPDGWRQVLDADGVPVSGAPVTAPRNGSLYAFWAPHSYTVNFYRNHSDSDTTALEPQAAVYGTAYSWPQPQRTGYTFRGWSQNRQAASSQEGTQKKEYRSLAAEDGAEVSYYALWELNRYAVSYSLGGADAPAVSDGSYTYEDAALTLAPAPVPKEDGPVFTGWALTKGHQGGTGLAESATYRPGAAVALSQAWGDVALEAVWMEPQGVLALSELLTIPADTFPTPQSYAAARVLTFLDGEPAQMEDVSLWQEGRRVFTLAGDGGDYSYTAQESDVSGTYDVYVDGADTGVDASFTPLEEDDPEPAEVCFWSVTVASWLDGEPSAGDRVSIRRRDGETQEAQLPPDPETPGLYKALVRTAQKEGDPSALWDVWLDGQEARDGGASVSVRLADGQNTARLYRFTARVTVSLNGAPTSGLGAVTLLPLENGYGLVVPAQADEGVFTSAGFRDDASYQVLLDGRDTGRLLAFTQEGRQAALGYWTLEARTYLDGEPARLGEAWAVPLEAPSGGPAPAWTEPPEGALVLPQAQEGAFLLTVPESASSWRLFVDGQDTGASLSCTTQGRSARLDYYTVSYSAGEEDGVSGSPPPGGRWLSGTQVEVQGAASLARAGHSFLGWLDEDRDLYRPGGSLRLEKQTLLTPLWGEDADAEALWIAAGDGRVNLGRLADAFAAADASEAGVSITLLRSCALGSPALLGPDDRLAVPAADGSPLTLTVTAAGTLRNRGVLDLEGGSLLVEGLLWNDGTVLAPENLREQQTGKAYSRVAFHTEGDGGWTAPAPASFVPGPYAPESFLLEEDFLAFYDSAAGCGYVRFAQPVPAALADTPASSFQGWHRGPGLADPQGDAPVTDALELYARRDPVLCRVVFYGMGHGEDPQEREAYVPYGTSASAPALTEEGWLLEGWYTTPDGGEASAYSGAPVTAPLELYARWTPRSYRVSFLPGSRPQAAPLPDARTASYGSLLAEPETPPAAEGQDFTGWHTDEAGTQPWDFTEDTVPARDLALYAGWRPAAPVTVRFDVGAYGLAGTGPDDLLARPGQTMDFPLPVPLPAEAGWTFTGWYRQAECLEAWDFSSDRLPARDLVLTAGWKQDGFLVDFHLNGRGDAPVPGARTPGGQAVPAPDPVPAAEGYDFGGWYRDKACTEGQKWDFAQPVTQNLTLYAKWDVRSFAVTFDLGACPQASPAPQKLESVPYGDPVPAPQDPAQEGWVFTGWYTDETGTQPWNFTADAMPAHDLVLTAGWRQDGTPYVAFHVNLPAGAVLDGDPPAGAWASPDGTVREPEAPAAEGYDFGGWYRDKACTDALRWDFDRTVAQNTGAEPEPGSVVTLYARWDVRSFAVTFDLGACPQASPAPRKLEAVPYGDPVPTPQDPALAGWIFTGWYRDETCTQRWVFANDRMPAHDLVLTAGWRQDGARRILFDTNLPAGAVLDGAAPPAAWAAPGERIPAPDPAPSAAGYVFGGWYRGADCAPGQAWDFARDAVTESATLYAGWTPAPCTVYYDRGGRGTLPAPALSAYGSLLTPPEPLSAPGWEFTGWYRDEDCTLEWDFAKDRVPAVSEMTLHAGWILPGAVEARFDLNAARGGFGGDPSALEPIPPQRLLPGQWADDPQASAQGYYAASWHTDPDGRDAAWDFTRDPVPEGGVTLYARWEALSFTVSFDRNGRGADGPAATQTVPTGAPLTAPEEPSDPDGFLFTGWYTDPLCPPVSAWDFETDRMPARDLVLYAGWRSPQALLLRFDAQGLAPDPEPAWAEPYAPADEPAPVVQAQGYAFRGWYRSPAAAPEEAWDFARQTPVAALLSQEELAEALENGLTPSATLYAAWEPKEYAVFYDTGGYGAPAPRAVRLPFGSPVPEPDPAPQEPGFTLAGWYTDPACSPASRWDFARDTVPADDLTLYARWTRNSYPVRFDAGGHGTEPPPLTLPFGALVPDPGGLSSPGLDFGGWYADPACTEPSRWDFTRDTVPVGGLVLYARWTRRPYAAPYEEEAPAQDTPPSGGWAALPAGGPAPALRTALRPPSGGQAPELPAWGGGKRSEAPEPEGPAGQDAPAPETPRDRPAREASLLSLLLALLCAAAALGAARESRARARCGEPPYRKGSLPLAAALAAAALLLFFLWEARGADRLVLLGRHTPVFAALCAAQALTVFAGRSRARRGGKEESR